VGPPTTTLSCVFGRSTGGDMLLFVSRAYGQFSMVNVSFQPLMHPEQQAGIG